MTCVTMNNTFEPKNAGRSASFAKARVRLFGLGYSIAAAALTFKNKPSLRLMTVIAAVIVLGVTLFSSEHMTRASLAWCLSLLAINILQFLLILWELRPLELQGEARTLHDFVFPNCSTACWADIPSEAARRCASRLVISPSRTRTGGRNPTQGSRSFGSLYWKKYTQPRHTR
jgi:hypothetical protein